MGHGSHPIISLGLNFLGGATAEKWGRMDQVSLSKKKISPAGEQRRLHWRRRHFCFQSVLQKLSKILKVSYSSVNSDD